jgi:hypothetical protein
MFVDMHRECFLKNIFYDKKNKKKQKNKTKTTTTNKQAKTKMLNRLNNLGQSKSSHRVGTGHIKP